MAGSWQRDKDCRGDNSGLWEEIHFIIMIACSGNMASWGPRIPIVSCRGVAWQGSRWCHTSFKTSSASPCRWGTGERSKQLAALTPSIMEFQPLQRDCSLSWDRAPPPWHWRISVLTTWLLCTQKTYVTIYSNSAGATLWHEIIMKIIPWELFFVIFRRFCTVKIFGKEGLFRTITREIRNFSKIIILK